MHRPDSLTQPIEISASFITADGARLHYQFCRSSARARGLVVLLHGMASNLTRWSEFVEHTRLKSDWDILRPDLRGHGRSLTRRKIGMPIWARDLIELLDAHKQERAILIGHSLGAHLALYTAARYPDRIRGIVMIDPVFPAALRGRMRTLRRFRWIPLAIAAAIRGLNAIGLHRRHLPLRDLRVLDESVRKELLNSGNATEFVKRYSSPLADLRFFPVGHYVQEVAEMIRPLPLPAEVTTPMLVLLSRSVTYADPQITARLLDAAPHAECQNIDAYHWPLTERPVQVREAIENWVARKFSGS